MSPTPRLRFSFLVAVASLWIASPTSLDAQELDCDDIIKILTDVYVEPNWDDLGALQAALTGIANDLREDMKWYSATELGEASNDQIKAEAAYLRTLRECMPRIGKLLENIRIRIDALEDMGSVTTTADPARRTGARGRLIDQLEEEHAKTAEALDAALKRAGIGTHDQEIQR